MTNEHVLGVVVTVTEKVLSGGRMGQNDARAILAICHEVARLRERNAQLEARQDIVSKCVDEVSRKIEHIMPNTLHDAQLNHTLDDVLYDLRVRYKICD